MERNPWWKNVDGPFPAWNGPVGVKEDGGGSVRGQGRIGGMLLHRAICNRDKEEIARLVAAGADVNEVEAAGNTPLHNAAFEGWAEGIDLLMDLGAKEHVPKVTEFYSKDCWKHHPKPYGDFVDWKRKEYTKMEESRKKAINL